MKSWFLQLYEFAFCCRHQRLSRLITLKRRTYAVCRDCGRPFDYSWQTMSFASRAKSAPLASTDGILQRTA